LPDDDDIIYAAMLLMQTKFSVVMLPEIKLNLSVSVALSSA